MRLIGAVLFREPMVAVDISPLNLRPFQPNGTLRRAGTILAVVKLGDLPSRSLTAAKLSALGRSGAASPAPAMDLSTGVTWERLTSWVLLLLSARKRTSWYLRTGLSTALM